MLELQSRTELLKNVLSLIRTTLRNKTNSKSTALRQENPPPPGQRCFLRNPRDQAFLWRHNNTTSKGRGRNATVRMFRKILPKNKILSRLLSEIVVAKDKGLYGYFISQAYSKYPYDSPCSVPFPHGITQKQAINLSLRRGFFLGSWNSRVFRRILILVLDYSPISMQLELLVVRGVASP